MKHIRIVALLLVVWLLGSCCTACGKKPAVTETPESGTGAEQDVPIRYRNRGTRTFLPEEPVDMIPLPEMPYTRPDMESLVADIEALTGRVAVCDDADDLLADCYDIIDRNYNAVTMYNLAYFRFCMDKGASFYANELDYLDDAFALGEEKENELYAALAASPCRGAMEEAYFGAGFFEEYDDPKGENQAFYDLVKRENDFVLRYYDEADSDEVRSLFVELVKVRQQKAAAKGYDSYLDYCYSVEQHRDYTPVQAQEFMGWVKTYLVPLATGNASIMRTSYRDPTEQPFLDTLSTAAERMGGPVWEAYRFMTAYDLCDMSRSSNKRETSYAMYLDDYEAPVIFIKPHDTAYSSLAHEFGHFVDKYYNYGAHSDHDISEIYSQVMEYLAVSYADIEENLRRDNLRAVLAEQLTYAVMRECAYADFEIQVYALSPEELTPARLDAIFNQCKKDYGINQYYDNGIRWHEYQHFFSYPGYVISYATSAFASMEICRMEHEKPGVGVEAFNRLLNRTHGASFAAVLEEAGLDDPFREETVQKTADFLRDFFDLS